MRLFPTEYSIELYEDGFEGNDLLNRAGDGRRLSELVDKLEDPLVIAIDGDWGTGKSHFLKCWVGAHSKENDGEALTVYIDAFESDFLDDPLVALTGAVHDRFEAVGGATGAWDKAKKAAAILWRPAARAAVSVVSAGIINKGDMLVDAATEAAADETTRAIDEFWAREQSKQNAIRDFREALAAVTVERGNDGVPTRLVVVVDELDRCRPDYALSMLEVVKHFFAVPNVHFVLGVNLTELQNSVRARYGSGVDASRYLQKFLTLTLQLNDALEDQEQTPNATAYLNEMAKKMGIPDPRIAVARNYFKIAKDTKSKNIRDMQKALTGLAMLPAIEDKTESYQVLIVGLTLMKVFDQPIYEKCRKSDISIQEVQSWIGIPEDFDQRRSYEAYLIYHWSTALDQELPNWMTKQEPYDQFYGSRVARGGDLLSRIDRDYVSKFQLASDT